jgi:hypothetical protein
VRFAGSISFAAFAFPWRVLAQYRSPLYMKRYQ